jgi:hypothetical protein
VSILKRGLDNKPFKSVESELTGENVKCQVCKVNKGQIYGLSVAVKSVISSFLCFSLHISR